MSVLSARLTACFLCRWTFVLVVVNATLLYLGCGAIYNMQQGNPFSFPHVRFWNNLYALVLDGIHFVSSGGKPAPVSGSSGGYAPVPVIVGPEATVSGGTTCVRPNSSTRFVDYVPSCAAVTPTEVAVHGRVGVMRCTGTRPPKVLRRLRLLSAQ